MRHLVRLTMLLFALVVWPLAALAETRVALVVGNGAYKETTPLGNPLNDARDVSTALKATGFEVIEVLDAEKRQIDAALRHFTDRLGKADVALFYYAGHGLQVGAENYLVPIDAKLQRERDLEFEAVKLDFVLRQMEIDREGKTTIVILDACRDNPLARNLARSMGTRSTAVGRGLAAAATGLGTFIAYSTQPGNVALDGEGRNSPFAAALVKHIGATGRNLPATMIEVRKDVVAATGGKQVPWDHSALTGDFYFRPGTMAQPGGTATTAGGNAEFAALQDRLRRLEEEARKREGAPVSPGAKVAAMPPVTPKPRVSKEPNGFELADNVRIDGLKLGEQRQPSPEACRDWCDRESGCAAYQHGRRNPVMGQCQLFSRVDARHEDASWRSGVRTGAAPREEATPSRPERLSYAIPVPPNRKEKGFAFYEGLSVMGEQIKMSATDSPAGCLVVCRNTPGCQVAAYNDFFRGKNVACSVYRDITNTMKAPSATLMVRGE